MGKYTKVEYMCAFCGERIVKPVWAGRPVPGTCIARSRSMGGTGRKWPHRWIVNRRYD